MNFKFENYNYVYEKRRFTEKQIAGELTSEDVASECNFSEAGKTLFVKAIKAATESSILLSGEGKTLPLQGVIDLRTKTIHIGALTPRDAQAIVFNEQPLFEHKQAGLFETGQYSPRISSYQKKYSDGPSAHQQLLLHAVEKKQVSADDAKDKRGFAINIKVKDQKISVVVDGNSLSINETAQYLRTIHAPGHELSVHEARNEVLKASGKYSQVCESWVLEKIEQACKHIIEEQLSIEKEEKVSHSLASANPFTLFAKPTVKTNPDNFDASIALMNQVTDANIELPEISGHPVDDNQEVIVRTPSTISTFV